VSILIGKGQLSNDMAKSKCPTKKARSTCSSRGTLAATSCQSSSDHSPDSGRATSTVNSHAASVVPSCTTSIAPSRIISAVPTREPSPVDVGDTESKDGQELSSDEEEDPEAELGKPFKLRVMNLTYED
jgi:hypothetical protein